MNRPPNNAHDAEAQAKARFAVLNLARISGLALVLLGIAIAQGALPLPYPLGVVLAVGGLLEFYFLPRWIARRWKAQDRAARDTPQP